MGGMDDLAQQTATQTNAQLADSEAEMLMHTSVDMATLRPQISDQEAFDKLISAVQAATATNESVAAFRQRLKDLGEGVVAVAKEVATMI